MLNCTKNWQPIWHNKINLNINGGLLYLSSGLVFPAAPAQNILLQKPTAGFFPNSFPKKEPSVVWLLMQKQWSSGRTPEIKTVSRVHKNSLHAPREKGRVARAPTSATVTNSLQSLQGPNTKKEKSKLLPHKQCRIPKLGKHATAKASPESTECLSKRRHPTKLGAKPRNRPEPRRVSAKVNCSGSAIADIYKPLKNKPKSQRFKNQAQVFKSQEGLSRRKKARTHLFVPPNKQICPRQSPLEAWRHT